MNLRRTILVVGAAGLLTLAPAAAFAQDYGADDFSNQGTLSTPTPALGVPFTLTLVGPPDTPVDLTITASPASIPSSAISIAGVKELEKTTDSAGRVAFTIKLSEPGTYTLDLTVAENDNLISRQVIIIPGETGGGGAAGGGGAVGGGGTGAAGGGGGLAFTGADVLPYALGAVGLVLVGTGVVVVARKRREV